jgi:hypothetical protein
MRYLDGREETMQSNRFSATSTVDRRRAEWARMTFLEKRRTYNRLYMRSWRADPRHRARDRDNRERWHYERKLRDALRAQHFYSEEHAVSVCGFCRRNPPVTKVLRLEIRDLAPRGYVEVRVPYCGEC